jgi:hypothetical protein
VEEGLNFVVVVMSLELLLTHMGMASAEILELHVGVVLLELSLANLFG